MTLPRSLPFLNSGRFLENHLFRLIFWLRLSVEALMVNRVMTVSERPARHRPDLRDSGEAGDI